MKRIVSAVLVLILIFPFAGCYRTDKEKGLTEAVSPSCISYTYRDKVRIEISTDMGFEDTLQLRVREEPEEYHTILSGEFIKTGWYDDTVFIVDNNNKYYSFDVESFQVSEYIEDFEDFESKWTLYEYTESEFKEKYPSCESFEWTNQIFNQAATR